MFEKLRIQRSGACTGVDQRRLAASPTALGPSLRVDFVLMGRAEQIHRFTCTETGTRDGISTLFQMGRAFAPQLPINNLRPGADELWKVLRLLVAAIRPDFPQLHRSDGEHRANSLRPTSAACDRPRADLKHCAVNLVSGKLQASTCVMALEG
jgi:hypothetical protein